jgi:hypothetical protein
MSKLGQDFEQAVCEFARTLDASAEVLFNHLVPDRDTGKPRQCDAWINTSFGQHWPLSILLSCKDRSKSGRRLHSGDIGAFCDEVRSTGANLGVIYTNTGFTSPALEKARANSITCCRLYQDEPADVPTVLCFEQFTCGESIRLIVQTDLEEPWLKTWNDLFEIQPQECRIGATVLDLVCDSFRRREETVVKEAGEAGTFPRDFETQTSVKVEGIEGSVVIRLLCTWKRYRARVEAHFIKGSWSILTGSFRGVIAVPPISMKHGHPGEGWAEIYDVDFALPARSALAIRHAPDLKRALREEVGPTPMVQGGRTGKAIPPAPPR